MRHLNLALLASVWLAWPGMAMSQTVDRGNDVIVNPITPGGNVLLYPGGQYMRTVRPLLQPGETPKDMGVIHLHMPSEKRVEARKTEAEARDTQRPRKEARARQRPARLKEAKAQPAAEPRPAKAVKHAKAEAQAAAAAAMPANTAPAYNPGFGNYDQGAAGLNLGALTAPPPQAAAPAAQPQLQPKRMAKATPPPASAMPQPAQEAPTPGLTKRSVILFAPKAADPAQSALGAIKFLAGDLNAAMTTASARVQIQAYGGNRGDKGSDARRLSLKRALAIRQVLIDDGVPAERIDVRAMGGADDSGPADRVDVYVKT
jgi:outer membrane protein OmpA-like peptidoglycan-associated protein